jgi:diadenylate cyclase
VGSLQLGLGDIFQIAILAVAFYFIFDLFRGTRSAQMLFGLALVLAGLIALTMVFRFEVLGWLLRKFPLFMGFALLVIFQPEIRQALAILGRRRSTLGWGGSGSATRIDQLVAAAEEMARARMGALIAIEREISLDGYRQSGTLLNAPLVPKLLTAIFFPRAPLHDGGVIVRGNTIVAAGCIFPLHTVDSSLAYGMRHRAPWDSARRPTPSSSSSARSAAPSHSPSRGVSCTTSPATVWHATSPPSRPGRA